MWRNSAEYSTERQKEENNEKRVGLDNIVKGLTYVPDWSSWVKYEQQGVEEKAGKKIIFFWRIFSD